MLLLWILFPSLEQMKNSKMFSFFRVFLLRSSFVQSIERSRLWKWFDARFPEEREFDDGSAQSRWTETGLPQFASGWRSTTTRLPKTGTRKTKRYVLWQKLRCFAALPNFCFEFVCWLQMSATQFRNSLFYFAVKILILIGLKTIMWLESGWTSFDGKLKWLNFFTSLSLSASVASLEFFIKRKSLVNWGNKNKLVGFWSWNISANGLVLGAFVWILMECI